MKDGIPKREEKRLKKNSLNKRFWWYKLSKTFIIKGYDNPFQIIMYLKEIFYLTSSNC